MDLATFVVLLLAVGASSNDSPRPNIVFILADDLGWNDVGFHGSNQIPTPNIDALAYSGTILNNYYVMPVCTPSRSALMTGRHPVHNGMQHSVLYANEPWGLPLTEKLLPEYLGDLGYKNHLVGKWHLGHFREQYTPLHRGFHSHFGYWVGHQDYYDHTSQESLGYWGYDMRHGIHNISWESYGRYTTDLFTEEAVRVIHNHDQEAPLFLYLAHLATHSGNPYCPLAAPAEVTKRFTNIHNANRRTFAGMLTKLDDSVGAVVEALQDKQMLNNTIIIFSTDNGGAAAGFNENAASNWPLRGCKDTLWEGGVRGAALVWSPLIPGPPQVATHLMHIQDWLPTLLAAVGSTPELNTTLDGHNLWPVLVGNETESYNELLLNIDNLRSIAAVRKGDWKLIVGSTYSGHWDGWYGPSGREPQYVYNISLVYSSPAGQALENTARPLPDQQTVMGLRHAATVSCNSDESSCSDSSQPCLFNVATDPCEKNNLASKHPDKLNMLLDILSQFNASVVQENNRPADPLSNPKYWSYTWTNWQDFPPPVLSGKNQPRSENVIT